MVMVMDAAAAASAGAAAEDDHGDHECTVFFCWQVLQDAVVSVALWLFDKEEIIEEDS